MLTRIVSLSAVVLTAVVLITYYPALRLNFYGDDYSFVETAGRSSLAQYLAFYFDPYLQTGWYRPMQGMLFGIEWVLFGSNPFGYHLVNILVHLANCLLLSAIVGSVTQKWHVGFLSALIYATLPLYGVAVFWPGDADFLVTCFYLAALLCWIWHLQGRHRTAFYVLAFICFLLALLTKEFGVTLPVILFLADQLLLRENVSVVIASRAKQSPTRELGIASSHTPLLAMTLPTLLRRYVPFSLVYLVYLPLEYYIQSRSVLTNLYGYSIANHVLANFVQYLAALAFPWSFPDPINYIWLTVAIVLFGLIMLTKKSAPLLFLGVAAVLAFLPVTPFPWFFTRYLYLAVMVTAVVLASLFDLVWTRFPRARGFASSASVALALIVLGNGLGSADAVADFAELGRQTRVPFRDISQRHADFPDNTYLYFVNPPTITSQLSGMFFLRYGAGVHVASDEFGNQRANLRTRTNAYVIYFDEQRRTREIPVEPALNIQTRPNLPITFAVPVRLEDYELASANIKHDQAVVVLLYWRGIQPIANDYVVAAHLVDAHGIIVAQSEQAPRRGQARTTTWVPGLLVVDAIQLPISTNLAPDAYRLEIALSDAATRQRVPIVNAGGQEIADQIIIEPIRVSE